MEVLSRIRGFNFNDDVREDEVPDPASAEKYKHTCCVDWISVTAAGQIKRIQGCPELVLIHVRRDSLPCTWVFLV